MLFFTLTVDLNTRRVKVWVAQPSAKKNPLEETDQVTSGEICLTRLYSDSKVSLCYIHQHLFQNDYVEAETVPIAS